MVLRRPQLPRKEETHDVIGQVLVILRRPQLLRKRKTHDVMLRSRRLGPFDKVRIGYAQGMLRVCSGYAQRSFGVSLSPGLPCRPETDGGEGTNAEPRI